MRLRFVCGAIALVASALPASAALIINPSFEQPVVPNPDFQYYYAGDNSITGWTIVGNSVDILSTNWAAHEGKQTVDLSGVNTGGIYQDIGTTPGHTYHLSFWLTANTEFQGTSGGPVIKTMRLFWSGNTIATLTADPTGKVKTNPGWTQYSYDLLATTATTRLQFNSLTSGFAGPIIDDLALADITPAPPGSVPLPPAALLGVIGAGAAAISQRRRKA
jgi:choice-of-anchor C domain-containing protein